VVDRNEHQCRSARVSGTNNPANQTRSLRAVGVLAARSAAVVRSWSATLFDHPELADCRAPRRARLAVPLNRLTTNTARTLALYRRDGTSVTFDRIEFAVAVTQHERAQRARVRASAAGHVRREAHRSLRRLSSARDKPTAECRMPVITCRIGRRSSLRKDDPDDQQRKNASGKARSAHRLRGPH
jgi:hypothetical protein